MVQPQEHPPRPWRPSPHGLLHPGRRPRRKKATAPGCCFEMWQWAIGIQRTIFMRIFRGDIYIYVYISNYICIYSVQYIRYIPVWSFCWINVPHHLIVIQMYIQISRNCEYAGLLVVFWSWEHHPILRQTPRTSSENTQRWVGERPVGDIYIYYIYKFWELSLTCCFVSLWIASGVWLLGSQVGYDQSDWWKSQTTWIVDRWPWLFETGRKQGENPI